MHLHVQEPSDQGNEHFENVWPGSSQYDASIDACDLEKGENKEETLCRICYQATEEKVRREKPKVETHMHVCARVQACPCCYFFPFPPLF